MRFHGTLPVLAFLALLTHGAAALSQPMQEPQTLLWMWDRPQRFDSLPDGIGVAYLHATVQLSGEQSRTAWRQWPLLVNWMDSDSVYISSVSRSGVLSYCSLNDPVPESRYSTSTIAVRSPFGPKRGGSPK